MTIKQIQTETDKLKKKYNEVIKISNFQRFFFPRALRTVLENEQSTSLEIADAAFKSTWFFHRWFFPGLFNHFFEADIIKHSEWLFKPTAIPKDKIGKPIEQTFNAAENNFKTNVELSNAIEAFKTSYKDLSPAFFQWFFPSALRRLLDTKNTNNEIINLIITANKSTFFYHKFLFPQTFKNFFQQTAEAKKTIDDLIIPEGSLRVGRNIETLKALKTTDINLDETLASIISSLKLNSNIDNYTAQCMLEKCRTIKSKHGIDTLTVAVSALFVYFKNNPDKSNYLQKFNTIVDAFNTPEITEIYKLLRDTPLLRKTDEATRQNIYNEKNERGIIAIKEPSHALEVLRLLKDKGLLQSDPSAQDNFDKITACDNLFQLLEALTQYKDELNQENFDRLVKGEKPTKLKSLEEPVVQVLPQQGSLTQEVPVPPVNSQRPKVNTNVRFRNPNSVEGKPNFLPPENIYADNTKSEDLPRPWDKKYRPAQSPVSRTPQPTKPNPSTALPKVTTKSEKLASPYLQPPKASTWYELSSQVAQNIRDWAKKENGELSNEKKIKITSEETLEEGKGVRFFSTIALKQDLNTRFPSITPSKHADSYTESIPAATVVNNPVIPPVTQVSFNEQELNQANVQENVQEVVSNPITPPVTQVSFNQEQLNPLKVLQATQIGWLLTALYQDASTLSTALYQEASELTAIANEHARIEGGFSDDELENSDDSIEREQVPVSENVQKNEDVPDADEPIRTPSANQKSMEYGQIAAGIAFLGCAYYLFSVVESNHAPSIDLVGGLYGAVTTSIAPALFSAIQQKIPSIGSFGLFPSRDSSTGHEDNDNSELTP